LHLQSTIFTAGQASQVRKNYIIIIWIDKINQEKTTNNYTGQQVKSKKGHPKWLKILLRVLVVYNTSNQFLLNITGLRDNRLTRSRDNRVVQDIGEQIIQYESRISTWKSGCARQIRN
jgi:hypothetical protein